MSVQMETKRSFVDAMVTQGSLLTCACQTVAVTLLTSALLRAQVSSISSLNDALIASIIIVKRDFNQKKKLQKQQQGKFWFYVWSLKSVGSCRSLFEQN